MYVFMLFNASCYGLPRHVLYESVTAWRWQAGAIYMIFKQVLPHAGVREALAPYRGSLVMGPWRDRCKSLRGLS